MPRAARRTVEDGGASDEHVDARLGDLLDVVGLDAAVDLQRDVEAALGDQCPRLARLVERRRDERLAAEARVDRHEQDDVDLVHHILQAVERGARVEDEARLAAAAAHELERAVDVAGRLRVEGDVVGARVGKVVDQLVDRRHHHVHVDRRLDAVVLERLADQRADGQVGHVVVVHHVEVHRVSAGLEHVLDLLAQPRKVGREDGGRDAVALGEGHARRSGARLHGRRERERERVRREEVEHWVGLEGDARARAGERSFAKPSREGVGQRTRGAPPGQQVGLTQSLNRFKAI